MRFRQRLCEYALKHGVTKAARRYQTNRQFVYRQLSKYDGDVRSLALMLMYGKEASNRKQEIDRQHYTIPNQRPKDKHCGKI